MPSSLSGVRAKRDRAEHHLNLIEQRIQAFVNSDPYTVSVEGHPERGFYQARLVHPKEFPSTELSLMVGDCIHNMRSALDYVAWELASGDISDKTTMFPICVDRDTFDKHGRRRIGKVMPDKANLLERGRPSFLPCLNWKVIEHYGPEDLASLAPNPRFEQRQ